MKMKSKQHSFHTEEMDFYEEKGRLDMDKVYKIWSCDGVKGKNYPNDEFLITWPYQSWTW